MKYVLKKKTSKCYKLNGHNGIIQLLNSLFYGQQEGVTKLCITMGAFNFFKHLRGGIHTYIFIVCALHKHIKLLCGWSYLYMKNIYIRKG